MHQLHIHDLGAYMPIAQQGQHTSISVYISSTPSRTATYICLHACEKLSHELTHETCITVYTYVLCKDDVRLRTAT